MLDRRARRDRGGARPDLALPALDHAVRSAAAARAHPARDRVGVGLSLPAEGRRAALRDAEHHDGRQGRERPHRCAGGVSGRVRAARGPAVARAVGARPRGMAASRVRGPGYYGLVVLLLRDDARRPSDRRRRARRRRPVHRGRIQRPWLHARAGDRAAGGRGDARRPRALDRHPRPFPRAIPDRTPPIQSGRALNVRVTSLLDGARSATGYAVIVDVFRAFTTAAFAVAAGAREVVLVGDHEQALAMKRSDPKLFLTGEIDGRPIPGFDAGNSPSAIERLDLTGRRVVQRTSSGTQGVVAASGARAIVLGSFVIAAATVRYLRERADEVTIVAMGQNAEEDADEDLLCARYLAAALRGEPPPSTQVTLGEAWPDWFPRRDAELALELDRFSFALPVSRENGLLIARPV